MPELGEHRATRIVHGVGHQFPSRDLLGRPDARNLDIPLSLGGHERSFADDKTCACPLTVISGGFLVRDAVRATRTGQRCHDEAILQQAAAQIEGFEKCFHCLVFKGDGSR